LRVQTTCPSCQGAGAVINDPCDGCRGNGYVADRVKLDVHIPAGVDDGMQVRVGGEGEPSPDGGPNGDVYCAISIKKHRLFQRDGKHLVLQFPIAYSQAALGATLEAPTLDGPAPIEVPPGTQSGEIFRLRGRGMPDPHGGRTGDLVVQVVIETPKKLSTRHEQLLRELAELENAQVTPHRKSFTERIRDYFTAGDSAEKK
jgi:molecular chaperone DnaJ